MDATSRPPAGTASDTAPDAAADTGLDTAPASRAAWGALAVFTLVNLFNYIDRTIVPGVGESIQHSELHITDSQFGVVVSAFLFVYMCAAPAFGAFGDRPWRLRLVAVGIAAWSLATALAGFAQSYVALLTARASVGIGEAAYSAIAPAMLADFFPPRLRGRVFAVFFAATPVGSALGYVIGGVVDKHYGWRAAFWVAGLPGLLLAVLVLAVADPRASTPRATRPRGAAAPTGLRVYLLLLNRRYIRTVLGYAAYTFALGGIVTWMPSFLVRVHHVPLADADTQLGGAVVVTGFLGTFLGGWLGDALVKRVREGYLWLSGIAMLLATPLAYLALTSADPTLYWGSLVGAEILVFISTGPINSALIGDVPPAARAAAMAGAILTIHVLGDVPAPVILGRLSERTSLADAVLIIPVAIAISGLIWTYAAWRGGRESVMA